MCTVGISFLQNKSPTNVNDTKNVAKGLVDFNTHLDLLLSSQVSLSLFSSDG